MQRINQQTNGRTNKTDRQNEICSREHAILKRERERKEFHHFFFSFHQSRWNSFYIILPSILKVELVRSIQSLTGQLRIHYNKLNLDPNLLGASVDIGKEKVFIVLSGKFFLYLWFITQCLLYMYIYKI